MVYRTRKIHLQIENYGVLDISLLTHMNYLFATKLRHSLRPYPEFVFPEPVSQELSMFFPTPLSTHADSPKFQFHPELLTPLTDHLVKVLSTDPKAPPPDLTDKPLYLWEEDVPMETKDEKLEIAMIDPKRVYAGIPTQYSPSQLFKESSLQFL